MSDARKNTGAEAVLHRYYPESDIGGFTHIDLTVEFYTRIAAILKESDTVLDYGAGRGGNINVDESPYRRGLQTLRGRCAHVEGCDIDSIVLTNPYLDHATVIIAGEKLPFADHSFDLVVCNWVFEHVSTPETVARELLRILVPGGYICAMTPNRWSYLSAAARLVGNRNHVRFLTRIQPNRLDFDVFPTVYQMNSTSSLKRLFGPEAFVTVYRPPNEPAYFFGKAAVFKVFQILHSLMPAWFRPSLLVFIRKNS